MGVKTPIIQLSHEPTKIKNIKKKKKKKKKIHRSFTISTAKKVIPNEMYALYVDTGLYTCIRFWRRR